MKISLAKIYTIALVFLLTGFLYSCDQNKASQSQSSPVPGSAEPAQTISSNPNATAEFEFQNLEHDFGTVDEGEEVVYEYAFKNVGEAPLVIQNAVASCGCTVPEWPREPIPVDGEGTIKVVFNTANRPNMQSKTITITANTEPSTTRLKLKGMVNPALEAMGPVRK
ncbi:MAG: DUF1573 domain-containing protein [Candidatus Cyclobacteriaceae bacterium M3_2C_046]